MYAPTAADPLLYQAMSLMGPTLAGEPVELEADMV